MNPTVNLNQLGDYVLAHMPRVDLGFAQCEKILNLLQLKSKLLGLFYESDSCEYVIRIHAVVSSTPLAKRDQSAPLIETYGRDRDSCSCCQPTDGLSRDSSGANHGWIISLTFR